MKQAISIGGAGFAYNISPFANRPDPAPQALTRSVTVALTLKQRTFVEHYLGDAKGNGAEAARLAGYAGDASVLATTAYDNLAHPEIAALIARRVDTLALLAEVARLPVEWFATLGKDAKLSLGDKVRALELVGKYHRLFVDRQETTTTSTKRIEIISIEVAPIPNTREPLTIDAAVWETSPPT